MAKSKYTRRATTQLEGFAEDLGRLLGTATAKAESWLSQRQQIVKNLTQVRDTASKLLAELGPQLQAAVRPGRPAESKGRRSDRSIIIVGGKTRRKRRKMSAKARAAISAAQKKRWAAQRAGEKKK